MMITQAERRLFKLALKEWGEPAQQFMVIEEMSELTKALSKAYRRGLPACKDDVLEELIDCEIMLKQLYMILEQNFEDAPQDYKEMKARKLSRLRGQLDEYAKIEEWSHETGTHTP